jgi:hypothetical protein
MLTQYDARDTIVKTKVIGVSDIENLIQSTSGKIVSIHANMKDAKRHSRGRPHTRIVVLQSKTRRWKVGDWINPWTDMEQDVQARWH